MTSLFKEENKEKLVNLLKRRKGVTHYMVLSDFHDKLVDAIKEAGFVPNTQKAEYIQVLRQPINFEWIFGALKNFFTPHGGEIFEWNPPERGFYAKSRHAQQCEILIDSEEINEEPGEYEVLIVTAVPK